MSISRYTLLPGAGGALIGILGLLILFRQLIGVSPETILWGSNFDPNLISWIVEWGYHILFEKWSWMELWDANQFFPHLNSLAFSDSLISAQMFYAPLRLAGFEPLVALYGTLIGFTLLGCVLTDWALVRIGDFELSERAVIIYVAHFSMPVVNFIEGHYQLFGFQLAPCFFLLLYLFLKEERGLYLVLSCLVFSIATGFATYFAPMAGAVAFLLLVYISYLTRRNLAKSLLRVSPVSIAIALVIIILLFIIQLQPYLTLLGDMPKQDWNETALYSALPWSFFSHPPLNSLVYTFAQVTNGYWERSYFPGVVLIFFAGIGMAATYLCVKREGASTIASALNAIPFERFAVALLIIAYALSLGPFLKIGVAPEEPIKLYLPFAVVAKLLPGFDNIRAPGRFGMFMGLPLGILMVTGIRVLLTCRYNILRARPLFTVVILLALVAVVVDNAIVSKTYPYKVQHKSFYEDAKGFIQEHEPVLVLPLAKNGHIETILNYMEHLKGSTIHYGWVVSGYGARSTPELSELTYLDREFQHGLLGSEILLKKAREIGVRKVIVLAGEYTSEQVNRLEVTDVNDIDIIFKSEEGWVWKL